MASLPNSSAEVAEDNASEPSCDLSSETKLDREMATVNPIVSVIKVTGRFKVQRISTPTGSMVDIDGVVAGPQPEMTSDVPLLTDPPQRRAPRGNRNNSHKVTLNVDYETIYSILGQTGFWQLRNFLFHSFSGLFVAFHSLVYVLWIATSENSCSWGNANANGSNVTSVEKLTGTFDGNSNCSHFPNATIMDNSTAISCPPLKSLKKDFAMDWDMVCTSPLKTSCIQAIYMLGMLAGVGYFTLIADRFGPKRVIVIAVLIVLVAGPFTPISNTFGALLFFRFCVGFGAGGVHAMSFVLAMETVPEIWRRSASSYFNIPFAFGCCLLPVFGHFVKDWKQLQLLISFPVVILLITCNIAPESPRWLIRKGIYVDAERGLRRAAKLNGIAQNVPDDFEVLLHWIHEKERTIWRDGSYQKEFFKAMKTFKDFPRLRFRFNVLCLCWGSIGMAYYGLTVSASFFDISLLMFLLIGGAVEISAYILAPLLMRVCGKNESLVGLLIVGGAVSFPLKLYNAETAIYLVFLAKLVIGAAYPIAHVYSFELMPTVIRAFSLGIFSTMAFAGAAIAPLIVESLGRLYQPLPFMFFGVFALLSGVILISLPETETHPLPQTLEEAEVRANKNLRLNPRCSFNWNGFLGLQWINVPFTSDYRELFLV